MTSPDELEPQVTLRTAVARFDELSTQHLLGGADEVGGTPSMSKQHLLELLALSEVISRKAFYGRQLAVRSARAAGASWTEIGRALNASKQAAWEAHARWIEQQDGQDAGRDQPGRSGDPD